MINSKHFFQGFSCIKRMDSPAIALGCCMIAIGVLLKNLGFNLQESVFSTFLTYALPGSLVMAESMMVGASLLNIFLAVWLVNVRLYPMTVALMPLLMHENQPRWIYYLSCHFVAVSAWLIMKNNYQSVDKENRIDYWIGVGTATISIAIIGTIIGFLSSDYLNNDMMIGLAIVNPVYFTCMMVGAMKTIQITLSVVLGAILGPLFFYYHQSGQFYLADLLQVQLLFL